MRIEALPTLKGIPGTELLNFDERNARVTLRR